MAWIKVPPENRPLFIEALPDDPRIETVQMFGGIAAKLNGQFFAGLFGLSTMLYLDEPERAAALALPGATRFDPMGNGRARSDKVMLPPAMMRQSEELRRWIARAYETALQMGEKPAKPKTKDKPAKRAKPKPKAAKKISASAKGRPAKR